MARYRGPVVKLARREGIPVTAFGNYEGAAKKAYERKQYPPGAHGRRRGSKPSEFGKQLRAKQVAKRIYGVLEKQFRRYYQKADSMEEATGTALLKILETRLDNTIYKAGLAETRRQARQVVSHGHVMLNGRRVDIPSIQLTVGDKFEIRDRSKGSPLFELIKKKKDQSPDWLKVDLKNLSGEMIREPEKEHLEQLIESQLIVEYYSK